MGKWGLHGIAEIHAANPTSEEWHWRESSDMSSSIINFTSALTITATKTPGFAIWRGEAFPY